MKIGLVSSGMEMLALFSFLSRYDHEYIIYYDSFSAPYGQKYFATSLQAVKKGIAWLQTQGVEKIIVPPVYELALQAEEQLNPDQNFGAELLPLFHSYLLQEVFPHSLVGKLGLVGESADLEVAQQLITQLAASYNPTSAQSSTKAFSFPFHFWAKACDMLNPLLTKLSWKSTLTNTLLKHELRYFKDARIDTIIPLNYLYFNAEKTIAKFLNFKKIRFHRLAKLEELFLSLTKDKNSESYSVSLFATDQKTTLLAEKRLLWKLQRGKTVEISYL